VVLCDIFRPKHFIRPNLPSIPPWPNRELGYDVTTVLESVRLYEQRNKIFAWLFIPATFIRLCQPPLKIQRAQSVTYFNAINYVLYAQPDSKVRSDVRVQRITKDKLEIFAITKQTIIFLSFVFIKRLKNYSNNNV